MCRCWSFGGSASMAVSVFGYSFSFASMAVSVHFRFDCGCGFSYSCGFNVEPNFRLPHPSRNGLIGSLLVDKLRPAFRIIHLCITPNAIHRLLHRKCLFIHNIQSVFHRKVRVLHILCIYLGEFYMFNQVFHMCIMKDFHLLRPLTCALCLT